MFFYRFMDMSLLIVVALRIHNDNYSDDDDNEISRLALCNIR